MSEDWRMDSDERVYLKDYFSDRKSVPTDKTKLDYPDAVNSKSCLLYTSDAADD